MAALYSGFTALTIILRNADYIFTLAAWHYQNVDWQLVLGLNENGLIDIFFSETTMALGKVLHLFVVM